MGALLHEVEAVLLEYFSFNWDRVELLLAANTPLLEQESPRPPPRQPPVGILRIRHPCHGIEQGAGTQPCWSSSVPQPCPPGGRL